MKNVMLAPGRLLIHWLNARKARNGVPPLNRFQRGAVHGLLAFCAFVLLVGGTSEPTSVRTATTGGSTTTSGRSGLEELRTESREDYKRRLAEAQENARQREIANTTYQVARVIDGDTFELVDGRKVRVLGIDSCEADTPGGAEATSMANGLLIAPVKLVAQPGAPDADRYGRLLRYVQTRSGDFGLEMVGYDHTGVYQGDNDASKAYVASLYANDLAYATRPPSGRECGSYPPPVPDNGDSGPVYVPDNDDDDRESRFCRRRWWC